MRIRSIATVGVPLLLAGTLATATPGQGQASGDEQPPQAAPETSKVSKLAATKACVAGKQKRAFSGGHSDWIWTDTATNVPGARYRFRGPKRRRDTVFVTVTAPNTYVTTADSGRVRVLLDGVDMTPAATVSEAFYEGTNYGSFAGQYCARVGKGKHRVRLVLESQGTSDTAYLFNPMLHVEVAE